jgi:hypothetical protein
MRQPRRLALPLALAVIIALVVGPAAAHAAESVPGVRRVTVLNYPDCLELSNGETVVVLGHHVGGRVLSYAWKGRNALYLNPAEASWQPGGTPPRGELSAGRFDIGPENLIPRHPDLWSGPWQAEVIGPRAARLTSVADAATGVQLVREFRLDPQGTHLACTQIIRNVSATPRSWCHWSRTFAVHGGIAVVPLTPDRSKFPHGYVLYRDGAIQIRPVDPNIRVRDGFLEVLGVPAEPKLGLDAHAGWFAYQMPHDQVFVKRYATYPDRVYNEVAGLTISIWYPQAAKVPAVELEPIGPREDLRPGASASFTEHWWLLENVFPAPGAKLDLPALAAKVEALTRS